MENDVGSVTENGSENTAENVTENIAENAAEVAATASEVTEAAAEVAAETAEVTENVTENVAEAASAVEPAPAPAPAPEPVAEAATPVAPVTAAPVEKKPASPADKKKLFIIIGAAAAAFVLLVVLIVAIAVSNTPQALIAKAASNTIADAQKIELMSLTKDVTNGGSVAVSANLKKFAKDDLTVQGKYYSDAKNTKGAVVFTAKEDDDTVLDSKFYYSTDKVVFDCPQLVDGAYGVSIKNLEKNLPGSIFDPDESTQYSLNDTRFEFLKSLNTTLKNDKTLARDYAKILQKYEKLMIKKVLQYSEVKKDSKNITVGGESIACTLITVKLDEDAVANITKDLVEEATNDKSLKSVIERMAQNYGYQKDPEDFVDSFYDSLEDMEDNIDKIEDSDIDLIFDIYVTKSGKRIAKIDMEVEAGNQEYEASVVLGKNINTSKELSFEYKDNKTGAGYEIAYEVKENSNKKYEATIEITESTYRRSSLKEKESTVKIEWDKKAGDFELKYKDANSREYGIKGLLTKKGDTYTFLLTKLINRGESVSEAKSLELTVVIDRKDKAPNAPGKFTEITTMEERDFKHLVEDISDGVTDLYKDYFN